MVHLCSTEQVQKGWTILRRMLEQVLNHIKPRVHFLRILCVWLFLCVCFSTTSRRTAPAGQVDEMRFFAVLRLDRSEKHSIICED